MYECFVLSVCLSVYCRYAWSLWRPEEGVAFQGAEVIVGIRYLVGSMTRTWVLWKSSRYSEQPNHLSNPPLKPYINMGNIFRYKRIEILEEREERRD